MNNRFYLVGGPDDGVEGKLSLYGEPFQTQFMRRNGHDYYANGKTRLIDGEEFRELEYEGENPQRNNS